MKVQHQQEGLVTTLTVSGPMVKEELEPLAALLRELPEQGHNRLLLDLSAVPFVDSKAMELLLDAAEELHRRRGGLKAGGATDVVTSAFAATRLSQHIELHPDRRAARRAFL